MTGEIKLNSLNILHISDAHIQLDAKEEVSEIVVKMINDALKVQKEQDIKIDLVCFTGDLIQRGDKALDDEKQLEIAEEILDEQSLNGAVVIMDVSSFSPLARASRRNYDWWKFKYYV